MAFHGSPLPDHTAGSGKRHIAHGFVIPHIARAAANMLVERFLDCALQFGAPDRLALQAVDEGGRARDKAGRAVAALDGTGVDKRLLQRVLLVGGADALDGLDRTAVRLDGEHTARVDRAAIHDDRTGAAFAKVTALLRARQVRALAQHVQKRLLRLHRKRADLAVERQVDRVVVFKHDVLSPVQNLLYVPYWPVSAALCAAAGLSLTGERASHILFFALWHILSRAGATALEGPFFGMGNSILSICTKSSV